MDNSCERCGCKPDRGPDNYELFDYCAECSTNLCAECMKGGCCGVTPAASGMEDGDDDAR